MGLYKILALSFRVENIQVNQFEVAVNLMNSLENFYILSEHTRGIPFYKKGGWGSLFRA